MSFIFKQTMNSVLNMMNSAFKVTRFELNMMNSAFKMMKYVFKICRDESVSMRVRGDF